MLIRVSLLWVLGLATLVPWAVYRLLFVAPREEYAFLLTVSLFWVFGFWGVVGPLLSIIKVRQIFRALEKAKTAEDLRRTLDSPETREAMIEMIASENHLPKFLVRFAYQRLLTKYFSQEKSTTGDRSAKTG